MGDLEKSDRSKIVQFCCDLGDEDDCAVLMVGIAPGLKDLEPDQHEALVAKVCTLENDGYMDNRTTAAEALARWGRFVLRQDLYCRLLDAATTAEPGG